MGASSVSGRVDEYARPRSTRSAFTFGTETIVGSGLDRNVAAVNTESVGHIGAHLFDEGAQLDRAEDNERVDIHDLVASPPDVAGELAEEIKTAGVLGLGVILGEVCPKVAISDRTSQSVNQSMTKHVPVRMGMEPHGSRDGDTTQDQCISR
jgi:hypothetical protein